MSEEARASRFNPASTEKVEHLCNLLTAISADHVLSSNLALHGGTALNLFVLDPERLSLDIDLNYIASEDRETMLADRQRYVDRICLLAKELGYEPHPGVLKHAGCTSKLQYISAETGRSDYIKVDLDFLNRVPLLPPKKLNARLPNSKTEFCVNNPLEVVAGKVLATTSRVVPRDLFDLIRIDESRDMWTTGDAVLDHRVILFYASLSNRFPNHGDLADNARFEGREREFEEILRPVLPIESALTYRELLDRATPILRHYTKPQDDAEERFLTEFSGGVFSPEALFFEYRQVLANAKRHPAALYKQQNIKKAIAKGIMRKGGKRCPMPDVKPRASGNHSVKSDIGDIANSNPNLKKERPGRSQQR